MREERKKKGGGGEGGGERGERDMLFKLGKLAHNHVGEHLTKNKKKKKKKSSRLN